MREGDKNYFQAPSKTLKPVSEIEPSKMLKPASKFEPLAYFQHCQSSFIVCVTAGGFGSPASASSEVPPRSGKAARIAELERALDAARQEIADLEARAGEARADRPAGADEATGEGAAESDELTPRDPQAVEAALRDAPGLDALSTAERQALKDALVSGQCVTTALESVFDDVPILALRNLIRDLNSGC